MVWKKDLEKLKKSLAEDPAPPKAPPPKPKPTEFKPMEEEDAVFLSAMGKRPKAAPSITAPAAPAPAAPPAPVEPALDFASAMGELKGMVALPAAQLAPKPAPRPEPRPEPKPEPPPVEQPAPPPALKAPEPPPSEPQPALPVQINLAAGMAIDVDGTLDLKGHGRNDAEERLKERILDGHALGWRTLHVVLGPAEDLRAMFLERVGSSGRIARYAQAPIPMGGSQAWIVYFRGPGAPPEAN